MIHSPAARDRAVACYVAPQVFRLGRALSGMSPAVEAEIGALMWAAVRAAGNRPSLPRPDGSHAHRVGAQDGPPAHGKAQEIAALRLQGLSYARIASVLGISPSTVRDQVRRTAKGAT